MQDEILIIEKNLADMSFVLNVVPGESVRMKNSDTLLILQRRMKESDLKSELTTYNEIFTRVGAVDIEDLCQSAVSYLKIKVLVESKEVDFTPTLVRVLDKEFKNQRVKLDNIIHLSKVNAMTADGYQREQIEKTLAKNEAFVLAFENELRKIAEQMEREPLLFAKLQKEEEADLKVQQTVKEPVLREKKSPFSFASELVESFKQQKEVKEHLRNEEKKAAKTRCVEIPFYDRNLNYSEAFVCKDVPAFSIYKRKNNVFFGLTKNGANGMYNNSDSSLVELTQVTEEFLQFMSVDLLSGDYKLKPFSEEEKESMKVYFDFVSCVYQKDIGVLLTVNEYLDFKNYYNRLVETMFELEQKSKRDYYRARLLSDDYVTYMESYGLTMSDEYELIVSNVMQEQCKSYVEDLQMLMSHHIIEKKAKERVQELIQKLLYFTNEKLFETLCPKESISLHECGSKGGFSGYIDPTPESIDPAIGFVAEDYNDGTVILQDDLANIQIKIQFQNRDQVIVDEALFAVGNVKRAVYDYLNKRAYVKKIGLYMNGKDVFLYSSKNASLSVAVLTDEMKQIKRLEDGVTGELIAFYEERIRKLMIELTK